MEALRCYSVSLGCPKNRVDTERLLGSLGVVVNTVDDVERAELIFINTCGFIEPAVRESVQVIAQSIADMEDNRRRPLLVVAGCLVGRYSAAALAPELPEVDLWLDNNELLQWPSLVRQALHLENVAERGRLLSTGPSYAWLKISDGCRHACSFCTIPKIRGRLRSYDADFLEVEAKQLLASGVKELVLVAQDVTAWGSDFAHPTDLRVLLDRLLPLDGLARLRLMYLYPTGLTKELLSYLHAAGKPFVPYFDVPVQHAHADVLSRMGRPFAHNPRAVIERIRSFFPDAALRTSLITGFPGETDEHFTTLAQFVQEMQFQHLGVFAYQAEEGTKAAEMPNQVDEKIKDFRRDTIMELQGEISEDWLRSFVDTQLDILVDAPHPDWPGLHTGRAWFQAPEIDGLVYISGPNVAPGSIVRADITESREYDLVALA